MWESKIGLVSYALAKILQNVIYIDNNVFTYTYMVYGTIY